MYRLAAIIALVGLSAAAPAAKPDASVNAPADLAEIRRIEELVQPVVNMDEVINFYAPDAVTVDLWAPGVYRGRRAIHDSFAIWLAPVATLKLRVDEINIASDGEFACALMQLHFDTVMKDGKTLSMNTRTLDALKKIDGNWQIVQQHVALPLSDDGIAMRQASVPAGAPLFQSSPLQFGPAVGQEQAKRELTSWTTQNTSLTSTARQTALYADESLLYDATFPGVLRGPRAIGARTAEANVRGRPSKAPPALVETLTNGRFAVQVSTRQVYPGVGDEAKRPTILRQSNCLVRNQGKWRSILEQRSYLSDVVSGKTVPAPAGALDREQAVRPWTGHEGH